MSKREVRQKTLRKVFAVGKSRAYSEMNAPSAACAERHPGSSRIGVLLAADFYASFPEEVDALIEADEHAAEEVRRQARRREQLLSP